MYPVIFIPFVYLFLIILALIGPLTVLCGLAGAAWLIVLKQYFGLGELLVISALGGAALVFLTRILRMACCGACIARTAVTKKQIFSSLFVYNLILFGVYYLWTKYMTLYITAQYGSNLRLTAMLLGATCLFMHSRDWQDDMAGAVYSVAIACALGGAFYMAESRRAVFFPGVLDWLLAALVIGAVVSVVAEYRQITAYSWFLSNTNRHYPDVRADAPDKK